MPSFDLYVVHTNFLFEVYRVEKRPVMLRAPKGAIALKSDVNTVWELVPVPSLARSLPMDFRSRSRAGQKDWFIDLCSHGQKVRWINHDGSPELVEDEEVEGSVTSNVTSLRPGVVPSEGKQSFLDSVAQAYDWMEANGHNPMGVVFALVGERGDCKTGYHTLGPVDDRNMLYVSRAVMCLNEDHALWNETDR